jgi:N-formylglutamate amidohydrolase
MNKLPILLSVPHGGDQIPIELVSKSNLTQKDIFEDGDALTREIFNLKNEVAAYIDTSIARAFIDLNRAPTDLPPANPDGVVKTITTMNVPVYKTGDFPVNNLIEKLLQKYHNPFHRQVDELQKTHEIILSLDCHSMLAKSPSISNNPGQERPLICLSNRGDKSGNQVQKNRAITCSPEWMRFLKECFCRTFQFKENDVKINDPFQGGYIIQSHYNGTVSWVQLEINRKLYLSSRYFDTTTFTVLPQRLAYLRNNILKALYLFCNTLILHI